MDKDRLQDRDNLCAENIAITKPTWRFPTPLFLQRARAQWFMLQGNDGDIGLSPTFLWKFGATQKTAMGSKRRHAEIQMPEVNVCSTLKKSEFDQRE
jgi:hypothetical protein